MKMWLCQCFPLISLDRSYPESRFKQEKGKEYMERFFISQNNLKEKPEEEDTNSQSGFWFTVFPTPDWEQVEEFLRSKTLVAVDFLKELSTSHAQPDEKLRKNEGFLKIHPRTERLGPELTYVCYRDIDEHGKERPIQFLMTAKEFILIEWNGLTREQITAWAQRGLLTQSTNLAQILATKVLSHHQELLEKFEDLMDSIEEGILKAPKQWQQNHIMVLHKRVIGLKKSLNAHQSVFIRLAGLGKGEGTGEWQELVQDTQRELDNVRQTHELVESLREAYQTALDNRANDIMKILTLLASVLLPINLLTSFFGMNFENMPLIHSSNGIIIFYVICSIIFVISLWYFRRMRWQK